MTGRKGRVVRSPAGSGRCAYELRAKPDSVEMDSLNGGCEREGLLTTCCLNVCISCSAFMRWEGGGG